MDDEQIDNLIATQEQFVEDLMSSIEVLKKHRDGSHPISDQYLSRIKQENKNLSNEIPKLSEIIRKTT